MSDNETLVKRLAGCYTDVVYLPNRVRDGVGNGIANTDSEVHATDPAVAAANKAYFEDGLRLNGDSVTSQTILRERPIHRMMIYLHAAGATYQDIADQTGFGYSHVRLVLSQPWARSRLVQILNESGRDKVKHFLTHEVSPSLEVLREVRDDPDAKRSERIAAANSILDRALGKPTVHVESENTNKTVPSDVSRLDAQIEAVRKELASKGAESLSTAN